MRSQVVLTDQASVVPLLTSNVAANDFTSGAGSHHSPGVCHSPNMLWDPSVSCRSFMQFKMQAPVFQSRLKLECKPVSARRLSGWLVVWDRGRPCYTACRHGS